MGYPEGPNDPLRLFTQQPYYSPIPMSPGLMNNPLGLGLAIYGTPMLQQLAGPGSFVPNQMPAQAISDQYIAYQHQRRTLNASLAAGRQGRDTLQNTMAGIAGLVSGERPSELTRQHADFAAGVVNDPFTKMFLGNIMGPEMMEDVLYGTKGDPAMLASAIGRTGFYQRDSLGGKRMSRQSIEQMTENVYGQLYGPDADIGEMRGFGAGRAGQMYEHLFQTGRMPQSIGALSAADRVRAVASGPRDEKTLDRLSEEFTHRELMETGALVGGKRYSELTRAEQKAEVAKRLPESRRRIDSALAEVDKFTSGASGAKSASEIEQLTGFGEMARNVDSSKAVRTLKGYAGAVKAIQEIFGAAGNPNAPMPALLALLDQLSGGSVSMSPTRMESNVRQLHNAAKDAGMGPEQMLQVHQMQAAANRAMGIGAEADMPGAASIMRTIKAAADEGLFGEGYGRMNKTQVAQELASRNARGLTSRAGTRLAAFMRMAENNPETMGADTDAGRLAAAVKAKEKTFVNAKGETVDIGQLLISESGLNDIVTGAGGSVADLETLAADRVTLERYGDADYIRHTAQRAEVRQVLKNELTGVTTQHKIDTPEARQLRAARKAAGATEEQLNAQEYEMDRAATSAAVEGLFEKTDSKMSDREKFDVMAPVVKDAIKAKLRARGVTDEKELERQTNIEFTNRYGATEQEQSQAFSARYLAMANIVLGYRFGTTADQEIQMHSRSSVNDASLDSSRTAGELAERQRMMNKGHETNIFQRLSDELQDIGVGNDVEFADRLESVINAVPITELAEAGAPNLVAAMRDSVSFGPGKEDLLRAYNYGRPEDIDKAATMMATTTLGPSATPEQVKEFTDAIKSKDPAKFDALTAGMPKEQRDRLRLAATGLRESKDFSFNRLLESHDDITPEAFEAQTRKDQIKLARKTASKIDHQVGLGEGVARGFGQLMRAQTPAAQADATEEVARQILGPLGNDEDVADLATALAQGTAYTPAEMQQKKLRDEYVELSRDDRARVSLAQTIAARDAAKKSGNAEEQKRLDERVYLETGGLGTRRALLGLGLISENDDYKYQEAYSNGQLTGVTLNGKELSPELAETVSREVAKETVAIADAIDKNGAAGILAGSPAAQGYLDKERELLGPQFNPAANPELAAAYEKLSAEDKDKVELARAVNNTSLAVTDFERIEAAHALREETTDMAARAILSESGAIKPGEKFDYVPEYKDGKLVGAKLNGASLDIKTADAIAAKQAEILTTINQQGTQAIISPAAAAYLEQEGKVRGTPNYNFTDSEQEQVVAALERLSPERREQIRQVAQGVGAVVKGPPLSAADRRVSQIADVFGGNRAAEQFGPAAAAAMRSVLDDKRAGNMRTQANTIARSILGKDADVAEVEWLVTSILTAGETGEYGGVDARLQYVSDDKRQAAREMIYGFNAASQLNISSKEFDQITRKRDVAQAQSALGNKEIFGDTTRTAFLNLVQSDTDENRANLARQLAIDAGIPTGSQDKEKFVEAITSGDPKKLDEALSLVTDPKKRAHIREVAEGMAATAVDQREAREAAAEAAGTAEPRKSAAADDAPDAEDVAREGDRRARRGTPQEEMAAKDATGVTAEDVAEDEDRRKGRAAEVEQIAETVVGVGQRGAGSEDDILQESATTAITAASAVVAAGADQGAGGRRGGGSDETKLSGTLKLQGLSEVIAELFADNNMEQPPDSGAAVDLGQAVRAYIGSWPHVSGSAK